MPAEMRSAQIHDQATFDLLREPPRRTIPVTLSSLKAYYASHVKHVRHALP